MRAGGSPPGVRPRRWATSSSVLPRAVSRIRRWSSSRAPAPRVADQPELPCSCCHARCRALRQLAGDLGAGQRAGVAVANHRVLPLRPAAARLRTMHTEMLRAEAQPVGRASEAVRQRDEIAVLAHADDGSPRPRRADTAARGRLPSSIRRRVRTCSTERPSRSARTAADSPAAVPALSDASSVRDQRMPRRGVMARVLRRATTPSGDRPSRREISAMGSCSA